MMGFDPSGAGWAGTAPEVTDEGEGALAARGQRLYARNCLACHGEEGRGDGPAAQYLYPKPRDFTKGLFKATSTRSGQLPTEEDLFKVITDGMPGSTMPSWRFLTAIDRWALVKHVKSLVGYRDDRTGEWVHLYDEEGEPESVRVSHPPEETCEMVARGESVYQKAECWKCHGQTGRGDGPSVEGMVDSWGYPIRPRDYTTGLFKGGNRPEDIFLRIRNGINGTPMPANTELTDGEIWSVVFYVRSLGRTSAQEMTLHRHQLIEAHKREGEIPAEPDAGYWDSIPPTYLALTPLWWRDDRIEGILVRAVHNGKKVALHVSWVDPSKDDQLVDQTAFADAVAIQLSPGKNPPFFAMGTRGEQVNIWQWKAHWEADLENGYRDVEGVYPNAAVDRYDSLQNPPDGRHFAPGDYKTDQHRPEFLTGRGVGNPLSDPGKSTSVEALTAQGFGTVATRVERGPIVRGKAVWDRGTWKALFARDLGSSPEGDLSFVPGEEMSIAFAVWDGRAGDRNGQKLVSIWHRIRLEE
jgi:mono/diheme cytochrome c family protein